jgi:hypothetical protein
MVGYATGCKRKALRHVAVASIALQTVPFVIKLRGILLTAIISPLAGLVRLRGKEGKTRVDNVGIHPGIIPAGVCV